MNSEAMGRRALPSAYLDLLADGVRIGPDGRQGVVLAVRRVMLAAQRCGWSYSDAYRLLTDVENYRLALQVATGKGGRRYSDTKRAEFLAKHWAETELVTAKRPAWTSAEVPAMVEAVAEAVEQAELSSDERAVMSAVLRLADIHGTTKVAAPARTVGDMSGLGRMKAHRVLQRLSDDGVWLRLVQHGSPKTGRANLYSLAPALLAEHVRGASPPRSQGDSSVAFEESSERSWS